MQRWSWVERKFSFDFPVEKMLDILERWRGTPVRIEERIRGLSADVLTRRDDIGWSIQENIGHLLDLEEIWATRIDQIVRGESELVAADMTNKKSHEANHNEKNIQDLLAQFRKTRLDAVANVETLDESYWGKSALHPRLQKPMRMVDLIYFTCEHDDYHLARIGELVRSFT